MNILLFSFCIGWKVNNYEFPNALLAGEQMIPQQTFIPVGSHGQVNEFNVIASVSKASRAAKQLNATIASK